MVANFKLPGASERCGELAQKNPLGEREQRIKFYEDEHIYFVDGVRVPRSVTGLVHSYCTGAFRPAEAVASMKASGRWEERRLDFLHADGTEMNSDEIAQRWERQGRVASARGTLLHFHAECWCNGRAIEEPHSLEFTMVLRIAAVLREWGFVPWRTELCVFHMGLKVAGQLDALFINDARQLLLIDWKRCKNVTFDCCWRTLKPPLEHLGDCNGWVYSLQLNMYRWILEAAYGLMVGERMYLAVVHTDLSKPRLVKIPHLEEEVEAVIADQLEKGLAVSRGESDEV